ncbi:MAG: DUF3039 domain-containing protein [Actinobacteria bacterium]|nr:DUF3039 domain-containing protein [Actinomycetota bacterium]MBT3687041.1 DUF3039 domain-containing protein [Actinomycetota bacterium]MBT4037470.1 DUF3039 domain-containing protein [Actinomycetota bacterium]MBT4279770.1 DUF3039 domain-containing protein [Actinomycetota bacterium]MBT4342683.1 DUF3039 domain-containing protein [Actinomycetota bacterium]
MAGIPDLETVTPTQAVVEPTLDEGDHDRFSHYARKADIVESAVTGRPVVALCGKVWVPNRNPDRYPMCPTCRDIFEQKKKAERGN